MTVYVVCCLVWFYVGVQHFFVGVDVFLVLWFLGHLVKVFIGSLFEFFLVIIVGVMFYSDGKEGKLSLKYSIVN